MRLYFFVNINSKISTIILSLGVKYSMLDMLSVVNIIIVCEP